MPGTGMLQSSPVHEVAQHLGGCCIAAGYAAMVLSLLLPRQAQYSLHLCIKSPVLQRLGGFPCNLLGLAIDLQMVI